MVTWSLDVSAVPCCPEMAAKIDAAYDRVYPYRLAGRTIRAVREARGWTQEELARRAGVSLSAISRAERGRSLSIALLNAVAKASGLGWRPSFTPRQG